MKLLTTIAMASAVMLPVTAANAQSVFNGTIGVEYIHAPDDTFNFQANINGSLVYAVTPQISFQVDLGSTSYVYDDPADSSTEFNYGIHAIYSPSDALDIGVFFSEGLDTYHYGGV